MTFDQELEEILKDELVVLKELTELSFSKTNAIMEDDLENLTEIVKKEEDLIKQIETFEKNRIKHLDNWGVALDTPISAIIEQLPDGSESLSKMKDDMTEVMERLNNQNQVNNKLISQNLEWIDFNINLMSSAQTPTGYGQNSKDNEPGDSTMFDRKV